MEYTHNKKKVFIGISLYEFGKEMCRGLGDNSDWLVICHKEGKSSTVVTSRQGMDNVKRYVVS